MNHAINPLVTINCLHNDSLKQVAHVFVQLLTADVKKYHNTMYNISVIRAAHTWSSLSGKV